MTDQVVVFTVGQLILCVVGLVSLVISMAVWIFHDKIAALDKRLDKLEEQLIKGLEETNKALTATIGVVEDNMEDNSKVVNALMIELKLLAQKFALTNER